MNVRHAPPTPSRRQAPRPASRLLTASTTNWLAEWKARKAATAPRQPDDDQPAPKGGDTDALVQWLTGSKQ